MISSANSSTSFDIERTESLISKFAILDRKYCYIKDFFSIKSDIFSKYRG